MDGTEGVESGVNRAAAELNALVNKGETPADPHATDDAVRHEGDEATELKGLAAADRDKVCVP
jgi:hypothetical protein